MSKDMEELVRDDYIDYISREEMTSGEWTTIDFETIKYIREAKLEYGEGLHLYVLEKVLNTETDSTENKVWKRVLKHLQDENDNVVWHKALEEIQKKD